MKKTTKQALALLLLAVMLLTILPVGAFAAKAAYSWTAVSETDAFAKAVAGNEIVPGFVSSDTSHKQKDGHYQFTIDNQTETTTSFFGIKFNTVAAGTYDVTFKLDSDVTGTNTYTIHVFPGDYFDDCTNTPSRNTKAAEAVDAGTYQVALVDVTKGGTKSITFSAQMSAAPLIVFAGPQFGSKNFVRFTEVSFSGESTGDAPTVPSASDPAPEATDGATEPSSGAASDNASVYAEWEVAFEDPISSAYFTIAETGVVNGHDYLYLMIRGGKLIVYDIDEGKQVDEAMLSTTDTPRGILVDENGIVWATGGSGLLRYDPFTGNHEIIPFSGAALGDKVVSSLCGIASDGNGKLYFGSMNRGYVICYDTATRAFSLLGEWLSVEGHDKDAKFSGYGGVIYKDGYLYMGIDGDMNADGKNVHALVKFDISQKKIVDSIDLTRGFKGRKYVDYLCILGDVLFCGFPGSPDEPIFVDISGSKMKFTELNGITSHCGGTTEVVDGKAYFTGVFGTAANKGFVEYDVATKTATKLLDTQTIFRINNGGLVTVEGDDRLPGKSVVIPYNDEVTGVINIMFWNPQTNETVVREANIGLTGGAGSNIISLTADPTGDYIYIGAYGNTTVAKYSVKDGRVVDTLKTYSHQTDSLMFYGDYLYAGNYSAGSITQIDPVTKEATPLFTLRYSVFEQCRMFNLTAGDNKVFCGTVPYSGLGGVLVWYDYDKKLTYVAGGPNPEDVYYADTSGMTLDSNPMTTSFVWYNAATNQVANFDKNGDGIDDIYLDDGTRQFRGVIQDQVLNNIIYQDGYIYGTSSTTGSSGTFAEEGTQAVVFVYDVNNMKLVATCDLADHLESFDLTIPYIDQLAADPDVKGKFWGGLSDTLFSFTFDLETKTFNVKEELSIRKEQEYSAPGNSWRHRNIIFDGDYIYVGFTRHVGTYMVRKIDTTEYYKINEFSPNATALGSDGNLYWLSNESSKNPNNLKMFRIADKAAPILAKAPLDTAQRLINALPDKITKSDRYAIAEARVAYDKLTDEQKAQITNLSKLIAAEEAFAKLSNDSNMTIVYVAIAAVVVLASAAVAVVIVLKKKKKNDAPSAE